MRKKSNAAMNMDIKSKVLEWAKVLQAHKKMWKEKKVMWSIFNIERRTTNEEAKNKETGFQRNNKF